MKNNFLEKKLREEIELRIIKIYKQQKKNYKFIPGKTKIHYGARVYDHNELIKLVNSSLDFWVTLGKEGKIFERKFAQFLRRKRCVVANSGSSADLLAVSSLCANTFEKKLNPGDEVITPAMGFPTTLAAILHNNLTPVFVDIDLETYNINIEQIESSISKKTRVIMFAHTLGNPADMNKIMKIAKKHNLYVIEDVCDALDSYYDGKICGSFGDIAAAGFYPAHHMMMGEGGAVVMDNEDLFRSCRSLRDWGREDLGLDMGVTNSVENNSFKFRSKFSSLPEDYDHKYIYTNIGYNLKPTDLQCAIGLVQLRKLPLFTKIRKKNFNILYEALKKYQDFIMLPKSLSNADPSWFAFPVTIRKNLKFTRKEMMGFLESKGIETRMLLAGNMLRQPAFKDIKKRNSASLVNSDYVTENSFFVGIYPGIGKDEIGYMIDSFNKFFRRNG